MKESTENKQETTVGEPGENASFARFFFRPVLFVSAGLALLSLLLRIIAARSPAFADFFTDHIASVFRMLLAKLTSPLPFSLAETLILLSPFLLIAFLVVAWEKLSRRGGFLRMISLLLSVSFLLYTFFVFTFACGYRTSTIDRRLGMEKRAVSAEELSETAKKLAAEVNRLSPDIVYTDTGFSVMPYSLDEMSEKLCGAYASLHLRYPFLQSFRTRVKPVAFSVAMSYLHTTGIYFPLTGEANLNIDFPDYSLPYTAAHELSHQRGVSREDEANFIGFLVCMESSDPYIRYSGALGVLEYVLNALYGADASSYREIYLSLDPAVQGELRAYAAFFEKYRESSAAAASEAINDSYLRYQGTEGTKSYGMVVDLAVAYFCAQETAK
ncbi:MAG: DUF3810 domain-containing protein [Clostridia bacterium]|nr:DUF3810 domain-containing protein [Clostridia bacterium]